VIPGLTAGVGLRRHAALEPAFSPARQGGVGLTDGSRTLQSRMGETCYDGILHIDYLYMDFLQGTLEMLVLRTLSLAPLHGYGIAKAIGNSSGEALDIEFGSLYPALKRLELKGWIAAKWETSAQNRRAKYYRLTPAGRKQLQREHSKWADFVRAVGRVMGPVPEGGKS
jgi:PadR family transcriptional regulator, regulatory protein PadR